MDSEIVKGHFPKAKKLTGSADRELGRAYSEAL